MYFITIIYVTFVNTYTVLKLYAIVYSDIFERLFSLFLFTVRFRNVVYTVLWHLSDVLYKKSTTRNACIVRDIHIIVPCSKEITSIC